MKKIYSVCLAVLTVFGASAAGRQQAATSAVTKSPFTITEHKQELALSRPALMKAPAAQTLEEFVGTYTWSYYGMLSNQNGEMSQEVEITIKNADTNEVELGIIPLTTGEWAKITAVVDLAAGTFTIPGKQYLFEDSDGPIYFYVKDIDDSTYELIDGASPREKTVGTIEGTAILFDPYDVWAIGDPDAEQLGWYGLSYANMITVGGETGGKEDAWEDYCTGTFEDGWGAPAFGIEPSALPWEVQIQRSTEEEGLYRIINPYLSDGCKLPATFCGAGSIVFSIADPECVLVLPGYKSGFTDGQNKFYWFNVAGFYYAYGFTTDEIKDAFAEDDMDTPVYAGGTITAPDCAFDVVKEPKNLYSWSDENNNNLADLMIAKLTFDQAPQVGMADVAVDRADASTTAYYNLQGQRVDTPANGIFIRINGNNVAKIRVK